MTTSSGSTHFKRSADIEEQDLSGDGLLQNAPRDEDSHPMLGGIPILAKIGQGAMGAVYYGLHPRLKTEVAVKVLPFHLIQQDENLVRRFFSEAQVAVQVRSPNIVNVFDVNEEAGIYYLVMEFVNGVSAADMLRKYQSGESVHPVPAPEEVPENRKNLGLPVWAALEIVLGATEGLAAAHENNVIHRDIKPDNILVPRASGGANAPLQLPRAKLADLGLAKPEEEVHLGTMTQAALGTPGYMAPEQIMDAKTASKPSDVFGMGVTLYALLTGSPPFRGTGFGEIIVNTLYKPHIPLKELRPDIPPVVNDLVEKTLIKDPVMRLPDGGALLDILYDAYEKVPKPNRSADSTVVSAHRGTSRYKKISAAMPVTGSDSGSGVPGTMVTNALRNETMFSQDVNEPTMAAGKEEMDRLLKVRPRLLLPVSVAALIFLAAAGWYFLAYRPNKRFEAQLDSAERVRASVKEALDPDARLEKLRAALAAFQAAVEINPAGKGATARRDVVKSEIREFQDTSERWHAALAEAKEKYEKAASLPEPARMENLDDVTSAVFAWKTAGAAWEKADKFTPERSSGVSAEINDRLEKLENRRVELVALQRAREKETARLAREKQEKKESAEFSTYMKRAAEERSSAESAATAGEAERRWKSAIDNFTAALRVRPEDGDAKAGRMKAEEMLGKLGEFKEYMEKAGRAEFSAQLFSSDTQAREAWEMARGLYSKALKLRPNDSEAAAGVEKADKAITAIEDYRGAVEEITGLEKVVRETVEPKEKLGKLRELLNAYNKNMPALNLHPKAGYGKKSDSFRRETERLTDYVESVAETGRLSAEAEGSNNPGKWEAALASCRKALDACPEYGAESAALHAEITRRMLKDYYSHYRETRKFAGHTAKIADCDVTPDSLIAATASWDGSVREWDIETGKCLHVLAVSDKPVLTVAFSPDGSLLATGGADMFVRLWEVSSGRLLRELGGFRGYISSMAFTPDGKWLAAGSADGVVRVWVAATGRQVHLLRGHSRKVAVLNVSADGSKLLSVSADGAAHVWDLTTGIVSANLDGGKGSLLTAGFLEDENVFLVTTTDGAGGSTVKIWNPSKPQAPLEISLPCEVTSAILSPDRKRLTAGCDDGMVRRWEMRNLKDAGSLKPGGGLPVGTAYSPDGRVLAVVTEEGGIVVWTKETGELLLEAAMSGGEPGAPFFVPDGTRLLIPAADRGLHVWENPEPAWKKLVGNPPAHGD